MARRISRKELKRDEFVEATAEATNWIEENWADVVKWVVAALIVVIGVLAWTQWTRSKNESAATQLAVAIDRYQGLESDGFADATALGEVAATFVEVAEGSTPSAAPAGFYAGAASFRLGRHDEAIERLGPIGGDASLPPTLRSTANAMLVEALVAAGQTERATTELQSLIDADEPLMPASRALMLLASVHTRSGDDEAARRTMQRVIDEYPESPEARDARERLAS